MKLLLYLLVINLIATISHGQEVTIISFSIPARGTGLEQMIFHQEIEGVKLHTEDTSTSWQLYQQIKGEWVPQLSQIQMGRPNILFGRYNDSPKKGESLNFQWHRTKTTPKVGILISDDGKSFNFTYNDSLLMSYRYAPIPVPEGVSEIFSRSGFVHPLKTLKGNILTRVQPPDHYHHFGLWHPWTRTEYLGEEIDFWNLGKGQGTVRFNDVISRSEGPLFSELTVVHDYIIHPGRGEQTVVKELLTYRLWSPAEGQDDFMVDVIFHMNPSTDKPLTIKENLYEGFTLRGPAHWDDHNVDLLTSQGKNKSDGNSTRARWVKVTGPGDNTGVSTVAIMTHPANYNFPEHIRIWPTGTNVGKGNVFININPAQDRDWILKPGNTYTLQYRVLISDRDVNANDLHTFWSLYTGGNL